MISWVSKLPQKEPPRILDKYGLWIFKFMEAMPAISPGKPGIYRHFEFFSLSHVISGKAWYCSEKDKYVELGPGDAVLSGPYFKQGYGPLNSEFREDAVSFLGLLAEQMVSAGLMENGVIKMGKARRLLPIIRLVQNPSIESQLKANIALQELLVELYFDTQRFSERNSNVLEKLLHDINEKPGKWWTVEEMSDYCNLSASQFRRVFMKYTGKLPKKYISQLKARNASFDLISSTLKIYEVAEKYGFRDAYHFSKFFKEEFGVCPEKYRKQ